MSYTSEVSDLLPADLSVSLKGSNEFDLSKNNSKKFGSPQSQQHHGVSEDASYMF